MTYAKPVPKWKLIIAIGANIPSKFGNPITTLTSIRPEIEKNIYEWNISFNIPKNNLQNIDKSLSFHWSPLFETDPLGGPINQPNFINGVLVVDGEDFSSVLPNEKAASELMKRLLDLEKTFGRERGKKEIIWGPRTIDIDLLSWGELQVQKEDLVLPHPRLTERNFVLIPLSEVLALTQGKPRQIKCDKKWPE